MPEPEHSSPADPSASAASSRAAAKQKRVLACILCQQRKVKCDRKFPCQNCVKANAQCLQATLGPRQRRRRFPERELLDRLRRYEGLLREHNINFEPLHPTASDNASPNVQKSPSPAGETPSEGTGRRMSEKTVIKTEPEYEAKNFWSAMNQLSLDDEDNELGDEDDDYSGYTREDMNENVVKEAWDQVYDSSDHLLFVAHNSDVDLSTLHPPQVQIFRLWQIYQDNVDPLLKITHGPTLQASILNAAGDVTNISPTLEALMFSIYCVAILSLGDDECQTLFASSQQDLLRNYRFGCQQALMNCGILRTDDRDCLVAFYLYLISVRPASDPRSLSSMLGVAVRIARRMGIHNEATFTKCTALEAEMRRRLWWSLIIFDGRISEMSAQTATMLTPTWDCKIPLNINDFDFRSEMRTPPAANEKPTEAIFAVVRSELAEFIRHCAFHLDFINPSLKIIAKDVQLGPDGDELAALEEMMENKYLKDCNPENPLHFTTIWTTRGFIAKSRLLQHYAKVSGSASSQTDAQRDLAASQALKVLQYDTNLLTSPLAKGYHWFIQFHFPFPAYIHLVQDLKTRPLAAHRDKSWDAMSENYGFRFSSMDQVGNPFFRFFARIVLQAWEAREAITSQLDKPIQPPGIVTDIQSKMMHMTPNVLDIGLDKDGVAGTMNTADFSKPLPTNFGSNIPLEAGPQDTPTFSFPGAAGQVSMDLDIDQLDWSTILGAPMQPRGW